MAQSELSLTELYVAIQQFLGYLKSKWYLLLLSIIIMTTGALVWWVVTPPTYTATLTYLVESSGGSAGSAILNQFGLGGGEGPNTGRIEEIAKSNLVGLAVLHAPVEIDGRTDLLGNFIIEKTGLREYWQEEESVHASRYLRDSIPQDSTRIYSDLHKRLLLLLYRSGGPSGALLTIQTDPLTLVAKVNAVTPDEELSLVLANTEFDQLDKFYREKVLGQQLETITTTRALADSLKTELYSVQGQIAGIEDRRRNIVLPSSGLQLQRLRREEQQLSLMYTEAFRNLQTAEFGLKNKQTNIEVIDRPFAPLYGARFALTELVAISVMVGGLIGAVILFLLYLRRGIIQEIAAQQKATEL